MLDVISKFIIIPMVSLGLVVAPVANAAEPSPAAEVESPDAFNLEMPEFSYAVLKKGQKLTASRDTYLLTPETFARITTEYEFMQKRYELHLAERLELNSLKYQYQIDLMASQKLFLETELERTNRLMIELQESRQKDLTPLWVAVSFVAGCALTVGLVYALEPGMN